MALNLKNIICFGFIYLRSFLFSQKKNIESAWNGVVLTVLIYYSVIFNVNQQLSHV